MELKKLAGIFSKVADNSHYQVENIALSVARRYSPQATASASVNWSGETPSISLNVMLNSADVSDAESIKFEIDSALQAAGWPGANINML